MLAQRFIPWNFWGKYIYITHEVVIPTSRAGSMLSGGGRSVFLLINIHGNNYTCAKRDALTGTVCLYP